MTTTRDNSEAPVLSIRKELQKSLMFALLVGSILLLLTAAYSALDEIDELFDSQLRQTAQVIQQQEDALHIAHISGVSGTVSPPTAQKSRRVKGEKEFLIQIWDGDGSLLYSSHPAVPFPDLKEKGFKTAEFEGQRWRSFSVRADDDIVQVSQPFRGRAQLAGEIALNILLPVLLLFPILGIFSWYAVRRGLRPLVTLSDAIGQRTPKSLAPIEVTPVPVEVKPLVTALNGLLERLDVALKTQRQFTGDAAHELRTPLTAIQLQLQLLDRAQTADARTIAMRRLGEGIRRCIDLVQKLLTSTCLGVESPARLPCDLAVLVSRALEHFAPQAIEKNISLQAERLPEAVVQGDATNLQVLIDNLVDNALRYTQAGGCVALSLAAEGGRVILTVADDGPGIAPAEQERVFDRFYRVMGTEEIGSGLGLAIVRDITRQHGGEVTIAKGIGGKGVSFVVTLRA